MTQHDAQPTRDFAVTGMTCGHCALSVREEVSGVDGVRDVQVDLAAGRLSVTGDADDAAITAAVAAAGYEATR